MDKFPLMQGNNTVGELVTEQEALYTWFSARCRPTGEGLWCAWAVGERGELRLGVLEPCGDSAAIRRRFSGRMTMPLGRLLRGEIRPVKETNAAQWAPAPEPERLFRTPWLRQQLRGAQGVLTRRDGEALLLALPYEPKKPFPLTRLFCFARLKTIRGTAYLVFCFNKAEWPVFH